MLSGITFQNIQATQIISPVHWLERLPTQLQCRNFIFTILETARNLCLVYNILFNVQVNNTGSSEETDRWNKWYKS